MSDSSDSTAREQAEPIRFGDAELPRELADVYRRAVRLEWITIAFLVTATVAMYAVLGSSQAMKAAWIEDLLSFLPPLAFLVAGRIRRRPPDTTHPYGWHRSVSMAYLVAALALLFMGVYLIYDSLTKLLAQEHPPIGLVEIWGHQVWLGWIMIAALAYTIAPPVILGHMKMKLADQLHDKVLYADADMNKADWMTAGGAILGILGIGAGLWWADSVVAIFIAGSITHDGWRNLRSAVNDLMDSTVNPYDDPKHPHPLVAQVHETLGALPWVAAAKARIREEGHVFQVEAFVVPAGQEMISLKDLEQAHDAVQSLDWKLHDVVIVPTRSVARDDEHVQGGPSEPSASR